MLGYRTYFDGTKFVADDVATEVHSMHPDSTTSWFADKISADNAIKNHNVNDLKDIKKCKQCGEYFWQKDDERQWFADREMKAPRRCYSCRKKNKTK